MSAGQYCPFHFVGLFTAAAGVLPLLVLAILSAEGMWPPGSVFQAGAGRAISETLRAGDRAGIQACLPLQARSGGHNTTLSGGLPKARSGGTSRCPGSRNARFGDRLWIALGSVLGAVLLKILLMMMFTGMPVMMLMMMTLTMTMMMMMMMVMMVMMMMMMMVTVMMAMITVIIITTIIIDVLMV
ncbi:hypothetical protein AK812_SmicGene25219 [Symbiodinium microadriaticum]|uniref:Uncharacterized protein n=1 Tax=Symbiodinium microadriaticum TaxID=2951 RepID=A0A1Q9DCM9_SYMMI|nr:hypothetical protein AK812_SmicGene25219 [Symbiodinium microadriaticum]